MPDGDEVPHRQPPGVVLGAKDGVVAGAGVAVVTVTDGVVVGAGVGVAVVTVTDGVVVGVGAGFGLCVWCGFGLCDVARASGEDDVLSSGEQPAAEARAAMAMAERMAWGLDSVIIGSAFLYDSSDDNGTVTAPEIQAIHQFASGSWYAWAFDVADHSDEDVGFQNGAWEADLRVRLDWSHDWQHRGEL